MNYLNFLIALKFGKINKKKYICAHRWSIYNNNFAYDYESHLHSLPHFFCSISVSRFTIHFYIIYRYYQSDLKYDDLHNAYSTHHFDMMCFLFRFLLDISRSVWYEMVIFDKKKLHFFFFTYDMSVMNETKI